MTAPPEFLALVGPTASGKTELSLAVADRLAGEIVSMDSRQVYRGMDVGTAKVDLVDRGRVPHHGLDLLEPDEHYSAGQFARDARRWLQDIRARGRLPILVGGTGFFLRALTDPVFREPPVDRARRDRLRRFLATLDTGKLAAWVRRLDPERAESAIQGGVQRMSRTVEVALLTGRPLSWWHLNAEAEAPGVNGIVVVLSAPREELDRRIDRRVARMAERGLVDEVRSLLVAGYHPTDPGMTGTGYREIAASLEGETTLDEALEAVRLRTRQYARRQLTWFRHQLPVDTARIDATEPLALQVDRVLQIWRRRAGRVGVDAPRAHEPGGAALQ
jgi:tRNA dimethylallyltransferase